jgi:hypothetical protein
MEKLACLQEFFFFFQIMFSLFWSSKSNFVCIIVIRDPKKLTLLFFFFIVLIFCLVRLLNYAANKPHKPKCGPHTNYNFGDLGNLSISDEVITKPLI